MNAPFQRFYRVSAEVSAPGLFVSNLFGEGLDIEWDVQLNRYTTPDTGVIRVVNLGIEGVGVYNAWRQSLPGLFQATLSIGWGGQVKLLAKGDIVNIKPEVPTGSGDVVFEIEIGDAADATRVSTVGTQFANATLMLIIRFLVEAPPPTGMGLIIPPDVKALIEAKSALLPIQVWNNYVVEGRVTDRLDELIDTLGLEWRALRGEFIATEKGTFIPGPPIVLSETTGLLSFTQADNGGCTVIAIANPDLVPGRQFTVLDRLGRPVGSPAYRSETTAFSGSCSASSDMTVVAQKPILI